MSRRIIFYSIFLGLLAVAAIISFLWAKFEITVWAKNPVLVSQPVDVTFPRGTTLASLSQNLEKKGLLEHSLLFRAWVKFHSNYSKFQAGRYRFSGAVSPEDIANEIIAGKTYVPIVFQYTVPEGFTLNQTIERLVAKGIGTREDFDVLAADMSFLADLNISSNSLEGYIYPATYSFTSMPTPREALKKAVDTFWKVLGDQYEDKIREMGLTLNEAVTFASLIELETQVEEEMFMVSEVIWKRLKIGMPLGIDAAVIYGIQDYDGNIRTRHLKDVSNPYNTRVHLGLPPGPIGSPSLSAMQAILSPTNEGYLYYVLDPEKGAKHHFSKSHSEHQKYVRKLVKWQRSRR